MTWQGLSANLGFLWQDRSLLDRISAAADAGFRAVELHWPYDVAPEAVGEACALRGLRLLAINSPLGNVAQGDFGLAALAGREAEFVGSMVQAISYAGKAGADAIHVMAGLREAGDVRVARRSFVRNLQLAVQLAPQITLLLEPLNRRDKPGYFYSTTEEVAELIEEIGGPNLRMMFDVYHVGVEQGDVLRRLERFLPIIGHIQIAGVPSRREPDEGEINYPAVFEALDDLGYNGWIGCEYRPKGDTDAGLKWIGRLAASGFRDRLPAQHQHNPPDDAAGDRQ